MEHLWGLGGGSRNVALGYLAAMAGMLWLLNQARRSFWLVSLLALPGTFCHELCHWLVGTALNGQPLRFTVLPRREGRGYVLGSVALGNLRWYNAFFIGLAPLLLLPLAYGLFLWRLGRAPNSAGPRRAWSSSWPTWSSRPCPPGRTCASPPAPPLAGCC